MLSQMITPFWDVSQSADILQAIVNHFEKWQCV